MIRGRTVGDAVSNFRAARTLQRRKQFDSLAENLGIKTQKDWYSLSSSQLNQLQKKQVISKDTGSLFKTLRTVYPEFEWQPLKFGHLPWLHLESKEERRKSFDWMFEQLQFVTQEDWYTLNIDQIQSITNKEITDFYTPSLLLDALKTSYPEFTWNPLPFSSFRFYNKLQNQRVALDWIAEALYIETQYDWYSHTAEEVRRLGGDCILDMYKGSLLESLTAVYPEFEWNPLLFQYIPRLHYNHRNNHRLLFDLFSEQFGIQYQSDWYNISGDLIRKNGGQGLMSHYSGSLPLALRTVYPEFEWNTALFGKAPHYHWNSPENRKNFFDWFAAQHDIATQSDWYSVTIEDVKDATNGSNVIPEVYQNNICKALQDVYPQFEWNPILFSQTPRFLWFKPEILRKFFNWCEQQLGIENQLDWRNFSSEDVCELGAEHVMLNFNNSIITALQFVYPEFEWNCLTDVNHLRHTFDNIADELDVQFQEEWYELTPRELINCSANNIGADLLHFVAANNEHESVISVLKIVYPEFTWFNLLDNDNQRAFMEWIGESLGIHSIEEWMFVKKEVFVENGGNLALKLIKHHGSWARTLKNLFYEHNWPQALHSSRGQYHVVDLLKSLLSKHYGKQLKVHMNHKLPPSNIELDVYIPSLSLAFEYQGAQHYNTSVFGMSSEFPKHQREYDNMKIELCKEKGITLIEIPYWWHNTPSSLVSTIQSHRPDLLLDMEQLDDDSAQRFFFQF